MDQTEGGIPATQIPRIRITDVRRRFYVERGQLAQGPVRPVLVVVDHLLGQDPLQMPTTEDQHLVEALTTNRPDEPLGEGIGSGCSHRSMDYLDAVNSEYLVEARGELGVPVSDQELDGNGPILQRHGQVPRLLDNPGAGRVNREEVAGQHR